MCHAMVAARHPIGLRATVAPASRGATSRPIGPAVFGPYATGQYGLYWPALGEPPAAGDRGLHPMTRWPGNGPTRPPDPGDVNYTASLARPASHGQRALFTLTGARSPPGSGTDKRLAEHG